MPQHTYEPEAGNAPVVWHIRLNTLLLRDVTTKKLEFSSVSSSLALASNLRTHGDVVRLDSENRFIHWLLTKLLTL